MPSGELTVSFIAVVWGEGRYESGQGWKRQLAARLLLVAQLLAGCRRKPRPTTCKTHEKGGNYSEQPGSMPRYFDPLKIRHSSRGKCVNKCTKCCEIGERNICNSPRKLTLLAINFE